MKKVKICRDCKNEKPIEDFPVSGFYKNTGHTLRRSNCKPCHAAETRIKYRTNPDYREKMKRYSREQTLRNRDVKKILLEKETILQAKNHKIASL